MADLNLDRIEIYPGINDAPEQASTVEGCNGAWIVKAVNNIIDEINQLKTQPVTSPAIFTITVDHTCDEEYNYISIISPTNYDFRGVSVEIDNPDAFIEFYLEVNSAQRFITDTGTTNKFTIDNPRFYAGDRIDLVLVAEESLVTEGYSETVQIIFTGDFTIE